MQREKMNHAQFRLVRDKKSPKGLSIEVSTPQKTIPCDSKEELIALLQHFSVPVLKMVVPDSTFARRNYVEKIRPALRYYCAKFNVAVPGWLKNEKHYQEMSDKDKLATFGVVKLSCREFTPIKKGSANAASPQ